MKTEFLLIYSFYIELNTIAVKMGDKTLFFCFRIRRLGYSVLFSIIFRSIDSKLKKNKKIRSFSLKYLKLKFLCFSNLSFSVFRSYVLFFGSEFRKNFVLPLVLWLEYSLFASKNILVFTFHQRFQKDFFYFENSIQLKNSSVII